MSTATYYVGDCRKVLATLPAASADLVLTSPPFLALRSYLPAGDPAKADEMGSEATPGEFIDALLDVVEELRRVLAPHGSLCIELGDSYAGSCGAGGDYGKGGPGWPLAKSLCMVPEMLRFALAYGCNPLTGRETPRWRVRNVVRHFRPNPPVGAVGDKVRPATSEWVVACTGIKRYFDLDSVRSASMSPPTTRRVGMASSTSKGASGGDSGNVDKERWSHNPAGSPPLDWWDDDDLEWRDGAGFVQPTAPYAGPHFATFGKAVVKRLLLPMCPLRVCVTCGRPCERIVEEARYLNPDGSEHRTDCNHGGNWRAGVVLDPWAGTGTTLSVATGNGRDAVGIDVDRRNLALARERVGMFLVEGQPPRPEGRGL